MFAAIGTVANRSRGVDFRQCEPFEGVRHAICCIDRTNRVHGLNRGLGVVERRLADGSVEIPRIDRGEPSPISLIVAQGGC